jgi:hypothetical protein
MPTLSGMVHEPTLRSADIKHLFVVISDNV